MIHQAIADYKAWLEDRARFAKAITFQVTEYQLIFQLTQEIETHLTRGTRHYWAWDGTLLTTLDEVVRAILADELLTFNF